MHVIYNKQSKLKLRQMILIFTFNGWKIKKSVTQLVWTIIIYFDQLFDVYVLRRLEYKL